METPDETRHEVQRLARLLAQKIRQSGTTQRAVEKKLGWGQAYLSQLLIGRVDLKIKHLLLILGAIGLDPRDFFAELYPPAEEEGAAEGAPGRGGGEGDAAGPEAPPSGAPGTGEGGARGNPEAPDPPSEPEEPDGESDERSNGNG